ncbi:glycosyltransferase family 2 protein [Arthrobacter psychrochitiniphilus]|uniref:Glycosyltransferase family 2 protein n=1 Tax=Arthrobacter psychrochitiniphilus TaxID=291045 RepID=A0A2V3DVC2_9MICC|nr:glycosyltransferase family 2 protein [Arthrobacter psychrochitiniphilus]NYG16561.1 GT2 family glycosyltransferase [Arthrobacter psychrochitiniphilus]PXA69316.1 glycosyltransferase family 2 protein [Arthrobacter psychrochitiniphilus]
MAHISGGTPTAFALLVVNYGSSNLLEENLQGLELKAAGGRIVIVDNFTSATELARLNVLATRYGWSVLALESNRGFGAAVNAGAAVALSEGAQALAVLNPDARIETGDLVALVCAVAAEATLMAAPLIRTSSGEVWFDGMDLYPASGRVASRRSPLPDGPHQPWLSGACFAISGQMWRTVGGFDEDYFLYWEDVDLSRRVVSHGGRLAVLREISAVHDPGGTQTGVSGEGTKSEIYYFYNIRNRLLYGAKHVQGKQFRSWIYATPKVSYEILCRGGRRQLLRSPAPLRAYVRGILSGLVRAREIRSRERAKQLRRTSPASGAGAAISGTLGNR